MSDRDLHDLLFADDDLAQFIAGRQVEGVPFLELCKQAVDKLHERDPRSARALLTQAIGLPQLESRAVLLAANALRQLGVPPADPDHLLGLVLDVPVDDQLDTLAVYSDGSLRYFNQGTPAIFVEGAIDEVRAQATRLLQSAQVAAPGVPVGDRHRPRSPGDVRLHWLTLAGTRVVDLPFAGAQASPFGPLLVQATQLLDALVRAYPPS